MLEKGQKEVYVKGFSVSLWKSVTVRLKENDLAVLNNKLRTNGFDTFSEFVHAWIRGNYPRHEKNEQIERLIVRLREMGIKDPLTGEFNPTFYRNVDSTDMLEDLSKRYVYKKHARDLVHYFERYVEIFFSNPELIRTESGHKRAWICDALRRFGEYYDRRFQNPELKILIQEIIERYELNRKMRIHDRVWLSDENYLERTLKLVLEVPGEMGTLIKFALYSGLRGEEITYAHSTSICNKLSGYGCQNLHVMDMKDGYSVVLLNRVVGQKHSYFTIISTKLWECFRLLPKVEYEQRKVAHALLKSHTNSVVAFKDLRKFHYNILCRSEMKESGADVLAGRARSVSAKHYLVNEIDKMVEQYDKGWKKYVIS
ncbi:MAG: integrase [Nitrososphaeraceae archaeon]